MGRAAAGAPQGRRRLPFLETLTARLQRPDVRLRDLLILWATVVLAVVVVVAAFFAALAWIVF